MKLFLRLLILTSLGLLVLLGCNLANVQTAPTVSNSTSSPNTTQVSALPTSIPKGQAVTYKDMQIALIQAEITTGYDTEYGSRRDPTQGVKFLWAKIQLKNISSNVQGLPDTKHFSAVYGTSEFKPAYGHRKDYPDYTNLKSTLYQGQTVEAWLRFDIPAAAELQDLRFVYLPDSFQVIFSFPTSGYTWADHPQFFWFCEQ